MRVKHEIALQVQQAKEALRAKGVYASMDRVTAMIGGSKRTVQKYWNVPEPDPPMSPPAEMPVCASGSSLNPLAERFVREYLVDLNGPAAMLRAGYPPFYASPAGARWVLANPEIQTALTERQQSLRAAIDVCNILASIEQRLARLEAVVLRKDERESRSTRQDTAPAESLARLYAVVGRGGQA